jgi:hypothetical protein
VYLGFDAREGLSPTSRRPTNACSPQSRRPTKACSDDVALCRQVYSDRLAERIEEAANAKPTANARAS